MAVEPWVAVKVSLPEHRKIDELMHSLELDRDQAIGKMVRIWRWIRINAVFGIMEGLNIDQKISEACGWKGEPKKLLDTLVKIHWFDKRPDGSYFAHDWDDHNFALIKGERQKAVEREQTRDRQRRYKARERMAQQNRYRAGAAAGMSYPAVMDDALGNGKVTRYPVEGEKNMDEKRAGKNFEKSTFFDDNAQVTRDLTGEVTRDRLLDPDIKHPHSRIIAFFLEKYRAARSEEYVGNRGQMARNIKELKREFDEEEIANRIVNYFASTDPYYVATVKFDWGTFYSQFNRLDKPVHKDQAISQKGRTDHGFDKPKGTEVTIDDFQ